MSAADIIELIKKLPPEEKAEVREFIQSETVESPPAERPIRYISDEKFDEVAPKIFEKHHELLRRLAQ